MSTPRSSRPAALDAALSTRPDGDVLATLWDALPAAAATDDAAATADAARDAAWASLSARVFDPTRVPYTDDVPAPMALVAEPEDGDLPAATVAPARATVSPVVVARSRWSWRRVAGAAGVAAALVAVVWGTTPSTMQGVPGTAATSVVLADGSTVWLDAGSRLSWSRRLGWPRALRPAVRVVRVEGQAFFAVARDGRPFEVQTTDATVRVLGTRFEVRTRSSGSQVAVEEGRVAVTARASGARVELGAGDATRVAPAGMTVAHVAPSRVATWRVGGFAAVDEPLRDVLAELARRYDTAITIDADVEADALVSVFYPQAVSLETVLADLCTTHGLRFRQQSRGIVITNAPTP
jgi:ferric-dicitrate binding protein FerR (iron transport regulator)